MHSLLAGLRSLRRPLAVRYRRLSQQTPKRRSLDDELADTPTPVFRWGATVNKVSNFAVIPFALLYAVFFADFGDHEHIFSPPRRWLEKQKAAFFSLSPAEQDLVRDSDAEAGGESSTPSSA